MKPSEVIHEGVPGVCMDPDAHYAQPRSWGDRVVASHPLTDRRIAFYERQGRYRERRAVWKQSGNHLIHSG